MKIATKILLLITFLLGILAIDGPYLHLEDLDGLRRISRRAATLGFDGKWAIHPSQLEIVNASFTPSDEEIRRAEVILSTLAVAESENGQGALRDGEEMLDEASRKMALAILSRAPGHERSRV